MHAEVLQTVLGTTKDKRTQPERELLTAIIKQALRDLKDPKHRADARVFFQSERFDHFCDCLTLNASEIRQKVL
jgi:hypothetical protein